MGWASGSALAEDIWRIVEGDIDEKRHAVVAAMLVGLFEDMDCDTLEEVEGPIGDAANLRAHGGTGAPMAIDGATYTDKRGDAYRFDGKRWQYGE